ncbi:T7SS effector LXG polymorphic toxin [Priestia aryabhattai]
MKTLDVDAFHENIQAILDSIKSQKEQIQSLISQVQAFSSLDDAFKGKGGEAIRSFYETGHASFLTLYHSLLTFYETRLTQITHALRSFEPSEDGYITQPFLQDTIPAHLNQTRNTTVSLVDQANAAIQKISHLASVSALNDQGFLTEVEQAKNKADKTMNDLVRFDEQQTQSLSAIQDQLTSLNSLLSKVKAGFQNGSIQPGNVSELSALAKKAMTDSGGVSVFEKGIPTTLTRKEKQEKVIKEVGLEKLIQLQAMTPAEQLKEIHKLEKNSPYIREVLTQIQQDTAPANMKKLAELSPAEQAVELEKSPYLQALNDSSTVGMLASQQILQNATGVEGMLMQSVMSQGKIRDVTPEKTAESFDFTEICENPAAKKEETGIKAVVKDVGEGAITLAKGTVTGTKGVAQDVWAGMGERADKRYNSLYDFGNYITMGGFDGAVSFKEGLIERGEKSFDSPYDFVNHATMGLLDVGQQALNPEKPLSKEHWENSMFLFASVIGGAKPAGAVKSVPKLTNVPRVPAHKATKTLSDMRNVVSPKAASNWSKKVYEPVQKKLQPLLDAEIPTLRPQPQLVGRGEALPGKTFGEALHGLTTYKMGNVSKGQSKALEKVEKSGGKADVEGVYDQEAVSKGTGETIIKTVNEVDYSDIRAYRDIDIKKVPIEYKADPRLVSEMNYKGKKKSGANAAGWERSASKHFNELLDKHPEFFSEANIERIENGLVPVVDDDFIKYFPQYKDCKGDKLIHHHIGGGGQAAAVPQSLHKGFGGIHNFEKEYKIRDNDPLTEIGEVFTSQKQP